MLLITNMYNICGARPLLPMDGKKERWKTRGIQHTQKKMHGVQAKLSAPALTVSAAATQEHTQAVCALLM
jgi:hypothetical protein